jgi:hypothetical protein
MYSAVWQRLKDRERMRRLPSPTRPDELQHRAFILLKTEANVSHFHDCEFRALLPCQFTKRISPQIVEDETVKPMSDHS